MAYRYSTSIGENCAKAVGMALPISRKQSIMVCNFIRNKNVQLAKKHLAEVIDLKRAVPFTRFNDDMGHKAGMAAGRYPVKACKNILKIVESAEANAQFKGLSTADLTIRHASAQKGPDTWHYGRHIRRRAKRTHIEIVLEEKKTAKKESKKAKKPEAKEAKPEIKEKPAVKAEAKTEVKEKAPAAKKEEAKTKPPKEEVKKND